MIDVANPLTPQKNVEGSQGFALINADGNGGMKIKIRKIKKKVLGIHLFVYTVAVNLRFMEIGIESIAAEDAVLNIDMDILKKREKRINCESSLLL